MPARSVQISFSGGEVAPELYGRIDDPKYTSGLATCKNFVVRPQGSIENRAGFSFVRAAKYGNTRAKLIPFQYSLDQQMMLEFGNRYIRFHALGQTLMNGSNPYEVGTTYTADEVFDIHYVQSGDVMTLVHPNHPPRELRRYSALDWRLQTINFGQSIVSPGGVTATANVGDVYDTQYFAVSAGLIDWNANQITQSEGQLSTVSVQIPKSGGKYTVRLSWGWPSSATSPEWTSHVYKALTPNNSSGTYQYLGTVQYVAGNSSFNYDSTTSPGTGTYPIHDPSFSNYVSGLSATVTSSELPNQETYEYVVTSIDAGGNESVASAIASVNNDLTSLGAYNTVSWTIVPGASSYNIYKRTAGIFGLIGSVGSTTNSFRDDNIFADTSITPPIYDVVFNSPGNYPSAVAYFEQRRVFAGTRNEPQTIWMTRAGTESNMGYSIPSRDDDRLKFKVAATQMSLIQHIIPIIDLALMTNSTEFCATAVNQDAMSPNSFSVRPHTSTGATNVTPKIINDTVLFAGSRGGHVYELAYNDYVFKTSDVSVRSPHLFDNKKIIDMANSKAPIPITWFVSSDGSLLGFTYMPEQQMAAWHRHETVNGSFESCAVISEGDEDYLYAVVQRSINGNTVRYIERMESRNFQERRYGFFVDSGISQKSTGTKITEARGLSHLEGQEVAILTDGGVHQRKVVQGGAVSLDYPVGDIVIGLPISAEAKTLPAVIQTQSGTISGGRTKNIGKVFLRVFKTSGLHVEIDGEKTDFNERYGEPYDTAPLLKTGELDVIPSMAWGADGQVSIVQETPLPATVLSISAEISLGG